MPSPRGRRPVWPGSARRDARPPGQGPRDSDHPQPCGTLGSLLTTSLDLSPCRAYFGATEAEVNNNVEIAIAPTQSDSYRLRPLGSSELCSPSDSEHLCGADWAYTLSGRSAVFHRDSLGIAHFPLGSTPKTIGFHGLPPINCYHWAILQHEQVPVSNSSCIREELAVRVSAYRLQRGPDPPSTST